MPPAATTPVLSRLAHDRVAHRRDDEPWLATAWADETTAVLVLSPGRKVAVDDAGRLSYLSPKDVLPDGDRVLLGEADGRVYFAVLAWGEPDAFDDTDWLTLRELGRSLTDLEVGLLTSAVALFEWHRTHQHCPRCGAATAFARAGWMRRCVNDGSEHFPRTDPAVIMLVHDGRGRCVLGRSPLWPPGRFSVLAGFVEAGESAEAAVAREVAEEVGIRITDIEFVASQPHPFPASLMLGFTALVDGDPTLHIDADEITEASWFTREEVRRAAEWGAETDEQTGLLRALPPSMSIARQLIEDWLLDTE